MSDTVTIIGTVLVAAMTTGSAVYASKQSRKATKESNKLENTKVDSEAYDRAQKINQEIVEQLQEEVKRLNSLLTEERKDNRELRDTLTRMETQLGILRRALAAANVQIPIEALEEKDDMR